APSTTSPRSAPASPKRFRSCPQHSTAQHTAQHNTAHNSQLTLARANPSGRETPGRRRRTDLRATAGRVEPALGDRELAEQRHRAREGSAVAARLLQRVAPEEPRRVYANQHLSRRSSQLPHKVSFL